MSENHYTVLGIPSGSTQEEIKAAYRRLAKEFHPDHYGKKKSPFLVIQEAYAVLSDPARRRTYDSMLQRIKVERQHHIRVEPMAGSRRQPLEPEPLIPKRQPFTAAEPDRSRSSPAYRSSLAFLLDRITGNFSGRNDPDETRYGDLNVVIPLTPEQAYRGGHARILVPLQIDCPRCSGRGTIGFHHCWRCGGAGWAKGEYPVLINYPAGLRDNHSLQLPVHGRGNGQRYLNVTFSVG